MQGLTSILAKMHEISFLNAEGIHFWLAREMTIRRGVVVWYEGGICASASVGAALILGGVHHGECPSLPDGEFIASDKLLHEPSSTPPSKFSTPTSGMRPLNQRWYWQMLSQVKPSHVRRSKNECHPLTSRIGHFYPTFHSHSSSVLSCYVWKYLWAGKEKKGTFTLRANATHGH